MKRPVVPVVLCGGLLLGLVMSAQGAAKGVTGKLPPDEALKAKAEHHSASGSLLAVLTDLAGEAGVTIRVDWQALEKVGVTSKKRVSVDLESVTYRQVLDVILSRAGTRGHPLSWRTDGTDVIISTHKRILAMAETAHRAVAKVTGTGKSAARAKATRTAVRPGYLPGVNFAKLPFKDTLRFFQTVTGENFHVNWRAIEAEGIDPETPITINVKNISIGRAMDLVFDEVNADKDKFSSVYWVIDRGVLLVSTGNALNKKVITRVIDAGGALLVQPDSVGPRIDLQNYSDNQPQRANSTGESIFTDPEETRSDEKKTYSELKKEHAEKVINTIKTMIGTEMWDPEGKGSIRVLNNKIVISQTLLGFKLLEKALR